MLTTRRRFLATAASLPVASRVLAQDAGTGQDAPRLRIAAIGVANRASANLSGVAGEEIVALCDVDRRYLQTASERFPGAQLFSDYRKMLETLDNVDAVVVSTPDHHHAPAAMAAIRRGLHVYCEKPLTHTVQEARQLQKAAAEMGVATQMGTQIHAGDNYRRVVETIRSGAIGKVNAVHVWVSKGWGATSLPTAGGSAPEGLSWNLWLGPASDRRYSDGYHPNQWRKYRDFGAGTLGDMGCHYIDLPFWALGLTSPRTIRAEGTPPSPDVCPLGLKVTYTFDQSDSDQGLTLTWYDGEQTPTQLDGIDLPGSGVLFVGDEGKLLSTYTRHTLFPEEKFANYEPPAQSIPPSIGHHAEWIRACKTGEPSLCHFGYSGPLTQCVLLGTVAHRAEAEIEWDATQGLVKNNDRANELLTKPYRKGWSLGEV